MIYSVLLYNKMPVKVLNYMLLFCLSIYMSFIFTHAQDEEDIVTARCTYFGKYICIFCYVLIRKTTIRPRSTKFIHRFF